MTRIQILARKFVETQERIKELYRECDDLFSQLMVEMEPGTRVTFPSSDETGNHRTFELVDNFATANVCFRAHGIHRFELKEVKAK